MKIIFKDLGYSLIVLLALSVGFSACKKDEPPINLPVITTNDVTDVLDVSAQSGGNVTSDGGGIIFQTGVCWSTSPDPSVVNNPNSTIDGPNSGGSFSSKITGLSDGTVYYVRAYAINNKGIAYGEQKTFITGVKDVDGNLYHAIKIGTQTWMLENLKTTKYRDGSSILFVGISGWANLDNSAYCWYNSDIDNKAIYGALYNWYAVNNDKILAPLHWHVPTNEDWTTLIKFLGDDESLAGSMLRSAGADSYWQVAGGILASNSSGFTALPGGRRSADTDTFENQTFNAYFWCFGEDLNTGTVSYKRLSYDSKAIKSLSDFSKSWGFSVRCVKD